LLFSKASRSALESINPLLQWVLRAVSGGGGGGGGWGWCGEAWSIQGIKLTNHFI